MDLRPDKSTMPAEAHRPRQGGGWEGKSCRCRTRVSSGSAFLNTARGRYQGRFMFSHLKIKELVRGSLQALTPRVWRLHQGP